MRVHAVAVDLAHALRVHTTAARIGRSSCVRRPSLRRMRAALVFGVQIGVVDERVVGHLDVLLGVDDLLLVVLLMFLLLLLLVILLVLQILLILRILIILVVIIHLRFISLVIHLLVLLLLFWEILFACIKIFFY